MSADIEHRFGFHAANTDEKKMDHSSVRYNSQKLALFFEEKLPSGREKALAITKLEEAMFWANAAIARDNNDTSN
jgi:hypothetical protein